MFAARLRSMAAPHWIAFFALILAAWALLAAMALPAGGSAASLWAEICRASAAGTGLVGLWAMWALMGAGMMAPTAFPALATYEELSHTGQTRFAQLLAGYLAVWLGFALLAAAAQLMLAQAGLLDARGASRAPLLTGALLVLAGLYQFSPMKEACLAKCRAPLTFFLQHWAEGPWRMGLRLGAVCLGCCWALMALAFVGGAMSLGFMALAMVLMTLEKLPDIGGWLTRPLGAALLAAGFWTFGTTL